MNKEILALLLVSLVVLVSGCTMPFGGGGEKQTATAGTQGLIIEYFGPDLEYVVSNQQLAIEARVKNIGDSKATNIKGKPYLLAWDGYSGERDCSVSELEPPNPEINREGGSCTVKWNNVNSPSEKIVEPEIYQAGVKISYDYTTTTTAKIYAISDKRRIALMERGEPLPTVKNIQNSNAPIHVEVRVEDVIIIPSSGSRDVPVTLVIKNVGNGNVRYDTNTYHYVVDKVTPSVEAAGVSIVDASDCEDGVYLRGGKEGTCDFKLRVTSSASDEIVMSIKVTTEYNYEITRETTIAVNPRLE